MLVDTSVWIDFFKGHASFEANRLVQAIQDMEAICLSGLVLTEILQGVRNDAEAALITSTLNAFNFSAEFHQADYIEAAKLYRQCRAKGFTIRSTIDCLIAQICLRDDVPLLTKDRDFRAIASCSSLRLIDV